MTTYLIDFENVRSEGLRGINFLLEEDIVVIFYSNNADSITFDMVDLMNSSKAKIEKYKIIRGGKNALDFQISTYIGYLICEKSTSKFYIISKDKGFQYVIDFWKHTYQHSCEIYRLSSIAEGIKQEPKTISKEVNNNREEVIQIEITNGIADTDNIGINKKLECLNPNLHIRNNLDKQNKIKCNKLKTEEEIQQSTIIKQETIEERIKALLGNQCSDEECQKISIFVEPSKDKQEFYRKIVGILGQKKGLIIYKEIRSEYNNLKKMIY